MKKTRDRSPHMGVWCPDEQLRAGIESAAAKKGWSVSNYLLQLAKADIENRRRQERSKP